MAPLLLTPINKPVPVRWDDGACTASLSLI